MSLAGCQINPIDVNFHLQKSLEIFDRNSAGKMSSKKDKEIKCQLGLSIDLTKKSESANLYIYFNYRRWISGLVVPMMILLHITMNELLLTDTSVFLLLNQVKFKKKSLTYYNKSSIQSYIPLEKCKDTASKNKCKKWKKKGKCSKDKFAKQCKKTCGKC